MPVKNRIYAVGTVAANIKNAADYRPSIPCHRAILNNCSNNTQSRRKISIFFNCLTAKLCYFR